jgi:hypothetical protein
MIPVPVLRWVAELEDPDLRVAYVESVEWLYEQTDDPELLPLISTAMAELGEDEPDDLASAILLECAGRWVVLSDNREAELAS